MRNLILGFVLGSLFTTGLSLAGSGTWGSKGSAVQGQPGSQATSGTIAKYDYYRLRQSWLDIANLRKQMAEERMNGQTRPCGK